MTIWVDADACPNVIKEILYRASERMQMPLILVANQSLRVPPSRFIRTLRVPAGLMSPITKLCASAALETWLSRRISRWPLKSLKKALRRSTRAVSAIPRQRSVNV